MPASDELTRDDKVTNLMLNFTVIMMAMLEGAFSALAAEMTEAMSRVGDAVAESLGGEAHHEPSPASRREARAQVETKVKQMFADLRRQVKSEFPKDSAAFRAFMKDPTFDDGIKIVESHPLDIPMLTEHLTDADFAAYLAKMQSEDPKLAELLHELGDWQKSTPHFRE